MNELMIFENEEFGEVRVIRDSDNPLFNLDDVCFALGYTEEKKGKVYLRKQRISKVLTNVGISTVLHDGESFIEEDALYEFIFESKTDGARRFRKWVTSEVLPQIRQTGGYIPISEEDSELEIVSKAFLISQRTIEQKDKLIERKNKVIEDLEPKAKGYDDLIDSKGDMSFKEFANSAELKFGRNTFMEFLRGKSILLKGATIPYQTYIERGYFRVVQRVTRSGFSAPVTLVTKKGVDWLTKKCNEWDIVRDSELA